MPMTKNRLAPLAWLLAACAAGCGPGPFARATTAYADANSGSMAALSNVPQTAYDICRKKARYNYLQARLGLAAAPESIPWNRWIETAKATETQSWQQYCKALQSTGAVFTLAVSALREYGTALKALAEGGTYDGSDIQSSAAGAASIALTFDASRASAAMKPAATLLGQFATFLFQDVTEDQLENYVRRADPIVQPLVAAMEIYVLALDDELRVTENAQRQTLLALEVRGGLVQAPVDADKLIQFYEFALSVEEDIASTRAVLDGYRSVAAELRKAHGAMLKAAERGNEVDLKQALGAVFALLTQVYALNTALTQE